jgi:hypothetical protein
MTVLRVVQSVSINQPHVYLISYCDKFSIYSEYEGKYWRLRMSEKKKAEDVWEKKDWGQT